MSKKFQVPTDSPDGRTPGSSFLQKPKKQLPTEWKAPAVNYKGRNYPEAMIGMICRRLTFAQVSKVYGIPESTARDWLRKVREEITCTSKSWTPISVRNACDAIVIRGQSRMRGSQLLTDVEEYMVLNIINSAGTAGETMTVGDICEMGRVLYCARTKQDVDDVSSRFSRHWFSGFADRMEKKHQAKLRARTPSVIGKARARYQNDIDVFTGYFDMLKTHISKIEQLTGCKIEDMHVYNFDETGFTLDGKVPKTVVNTAIRGRQSTTYATATYDKSQSHFTATMCIRGDGGIVPLVQVLHVGVTAGENNLSGLPGGSNYLVQGSKKGNQSVSSMEAYAEALAVTMRAQHPRVAGKPLQPLLLLFDNYDAHCRPSVINSFQKRGIYIMTMPPHTTHLCQPMDNGFIGHVKALYSKAAQDLRAGGMPMNKINSNIALYNAMKTVFDNKPKSGQKSSSEAIISSFVKCGLHPIAELPGVSASNFDDMRKVSEEYEILKELQETVSMEPTKKKSTGRVTGAAATSAARRYDAVVHEKLTHPTMFKAMTDALLEYKREKAKIQMEVYKSRLVTVPRMKAEELNQAIIAKAQEAEQALEDDGEGEDESNAEGGEVERKKAILNFGTGDMLLANHAAKEAARKAKVEAADAKKAEAAAAREAKKTTRGGRKGKKRMEVDIADTTDEDPTPSDNEDDDDVSLGPPPAAPKKKTAAGVKRGKIASVGVAISPVSCCHLGCNH